MVSSGSSTDGYCQRSATRNADGLVGWTPGGSPGDQKRTAAGPAAVQPASGRRSDESYAAFFAAAGSLKSWSAF